MKTPVSLTPEELVRLLAKARERRLRDWVMILVTYWHGLRASETIHLRVCDLADGFLTIRRGKGSEDNVHPLQEHENPLLNERAAFEEWFRERDASGPKGGRRRNVARKKAQQSSQNVAFLADDYALLFPISRSQFWRLYRGYAKAAGLPAGLPYRNKRKTHALKHTIARHLAQDNLPIPDLAQYLGWKKIQTAAIYTVADEDEVTSRASKIIRQKQAFRKELQQPLFPALSDQLRKPN